MDWTTIDQNLIRRFLSFRPAIAKTRDLMDYIAFWEDCPPEYPEMFGFRRKKCAEWQQEASELSAALRKKANPPIWEAVSDP